MCSFALRPASSMEDWMAGFPLMTVIPGSDGSATAGGAAAGGSSEPSALISAVEEASRSKTSWASGLNSLVSAVVAGTGSSRPSSCGSGCSSARRRRQGA
ncbi:hypothetical protein AB0407_07410 [Streptomyces microflavus]